MARPDRPISEPAGRRILAPEHVDRVAEAVLVLASEVYALNDRMMVLEAVLRNHGIDARAEIDAFEPTKAFETTLDKRRDEIIAGVVAALKG